MHYDLNNLIKRLVISTNLTNHIFFMVLIGPMLLAQPGFAEPDPRRIEDGIWKTVVRIEGVRNANDTTVGTGFVVSKEIVRNGQTNRVSFLVTNKHMVGDWNAADGDISKFYETLRVFCYSPYEGCQHVAYEGCQHVVGRRLRVFLGVTSAARSATE